MRKSLLILGSAAFAAALSFGAAARGGPGGGGFGGGFGGFSHGTPGGPAAGGSAYENSNGRFSQDRDRGLDRAEDRMSQKGLEHEKATDARKKRNPREAQTGPGK